MKALMGRVFLVVNFPLLSLYLSCLSLLACRVLGEKSAHSLMGVPMYTTCCLSIAAFNNLSLSLTFCHLSYLFSHCCPLWVDPGGDFLCFLDLDVFILPQVREVSSCCVFKYVLCSLSLFSWDPQIPISALKIWLTQPTKVVIITDNF